MSQIKTLNGVQYTLPNYNDTAWGANTGNVLTQYLAAIADVTLQLSGGAFTLTADADFGANFGLKALYLKSETASPASAGVVRLAKTDAIKWRNNAGGGDLALDIDGSDNLIYATNKVYTAGGAAGIVNADIASGAAIAYSKLALTGSVVNADIGASAAIAYSKLALTGAVLNADLAGSIAYSKLVLTGSIVNGDLTAGTILNTAINASAAIALSKLAALGTAKALQSNAATGFIEASSVTNTELGYVSGVTSAIQTQLNGKQASGTYVSIPMTATLTFDSYATHGVHGTATNDDAAAGNVGEYVSASFSSSSFPTSGQWGDAASISLTAGDWDVTIKGTAHANGATVTEIDIGVSATSGNSAPSTNGVNKISGQAPASTFDTGVALPNVRFSLAGTATHYFKFLGFYSAATPQLSGIISARRIR